MAKFTLQIKKQATLAEENNVKKPLLFHFKQHFSSKKYFQIQTNNQTGMWVKGQ